MLGRASDVETFIMNGQDEARIDIELQDETIDEQQRNGQERKHPVFTRIIRRTGSPPSSFLISGQPSTAKKVRERVMQDFAISVDNLCTFLPQDRVGSFSGFDAKSLLIETEKALSNNHQLWRTHEELIKEQAQLVTGWSSVESMREKLQQMQAENQRLEREKQRMEERDQALLQAEQLRKKVVWFEFESFRHQAMEAQQAKKQKKAELKQLMESLQPLEEQCNEAEEKANRLETRYKTLDQQIQKIQKEQEKQHQKYVKHEDAIEETYIEIQEMDSQRALLKNAVEEHRAKVETLRQTLADLPSLDTVQEAFEVTQQERRACHPRFEEAKRELRQLHDQHRELQENHKRNQAKLSKLQDERTQRIELVFRQQPKLKQVYDWVQANRSRFRKEVVGPIVCEMSPKSRNAAAYLEQHIPNATLKSFVVRTKEDQDLLYNEVRSKLKLPVNIILIKNIQEKPRIYSEERMNVLKNEYGIIGYLDEAFTAPDVVLAAVKTSAQVEKVLVGTEKTYQILDKCSAELVDYLAKPEGGQSKPQSCCIFAPKGASSQKFTSVLSKYQSKQSLRIDDISPAKWLAPGVSEDAKQKVADELKRLEQQLEELTPAFTNAQEKMARVQQEAQEAQSRLKDAKDNLENLKKVQGKLKNAERKLFESEEALAVDNEDEKKQKITMLKNRQAASTAALEAHAQCQKDMLERTYKCAAARINKEIVSAEAHRIRYCSFEGLRSDFLVTRELTNPFAQMLQADVRGAETAVPRFRSAICSCKQTFC